MSIEPAQPDPERERLDEIVRLCIKREARAVAKVQIAKAEHAAAVKSLADARQRAAEWIKANPDPQRSIFEELDHV